MDLYVVGYPKSGNTWLSRLLGDLLDSPVQARKPKQAIGDEGFDRKGKYIIRQEHIDSKRYSGESPIVLVARDPRDVAISAWKYWNRPSLIDTIHLMGKGLWPITHGGGWSNFYEYWLSSNNYSVMVKYESLLANTELALLNVCRALGVDNAQINEKMHEVVKRQSFDSRKDIARKHGDDLPYGSTVQNSLLRKGISGDWKNHFDRECELLSRSYFKKTAEKLGYSL